MTAKTEMNSFPKITVFSVFDNKKHLLSSKNKIINLYLCGPTVYSDVHIGNLRGPLFFHLLTNLLKWQQIPFRYYQNITDIDDKIIAKAQKSGSNEKAISNYYLQQYHSILKDLGLLSSALQFIKVTDHIDDIIATIQKLITQQFAYQIADGVYFDVSALANYHHLTKRTTSQSQQHNLLKDNAKPCCLTYLKQTKQIPTPTQVHLVKRHCADFALWKCKTNGQTWDSPWGPGRPGWHTECVVLINLLFGNSLDLHGGGIDLIYPHHHNELAQFVALSAKQPVVDCWWHNGLIHFDNQKISKSNTNSIIPWLVKNFLLQYNANILKLLLYSQVYETDLFISSEKIQQQVFLDQKIYHLLQRTQLELIIERQQTLAEFRETDSVLWNKFMSILCNNLRTHLFIDEINTLIKTINKLLDDKNVVQAATLVKTLLKSFPLLNLDYVAPQIDVNAKKEILLWHQAVLKKDFVIADKLRSKLQKQNILPTKNN